MQGEPLSQPFPGLGTITEDTETTESSCAQREEVNCLKVMQDQT